MKTVGIVLAAGKSERFGAGDKLLADLGGRELASYSAKAMRGTHLEAMIACVSNHEVASIFNGFEIVTVNGQQSNSLKAGLQKAIELGADRVLVALADMPNITTHHLNTLLARSEPVVACTFQNRAIAPAVFSKSYFNQLLNIEGDVGARQVLNNATEISLVELSAHEAKDIDIASDL